MKKVAWLTTVFIIFLIFSFANAQWKSDYVAATDASESRPNIDVHNNTVHVVYQHYFPGKNKKNPSYYELYHCQFTNELSSPEQITFEKKYIIKPAIAVDGSGVVHIAVMDRSNQQVLYLYGESGNFSDPVALNSTDSWDYLMAVEIEVESDGTPHIIVYAGTDSETQGFDHLYYVTQSDDGFVEENLSLLFPNLAMQPRDISIDVVDNVVHIGCRTEQLNPFKYNIYYIQNSTGDFEIQQVYEQDLQNEISLRNARIAIDANGLAHIIHVKSVYDSELGYTRYVLDAVFNGSDLTAINEIYTTDQTLFSVDAAATLDDVAILMRETGPTEDLLLKMASSELSDPADLVGTGSRLSYFWEKIVADATGNIHIVCRESNETRDIIYFTNNPNFVGQGGNEGGDLHVASIDITTNAKGKSVNARASVKIVDADGDPVEDALVSGVWSGLTDDSDEFATGSDGFGTANSDKVDKKSRGYFTFNVSNVIKSGWEYDTTHPNNVTSGSVQWNVAGKIIAENSESIPTTTDLIGNYPNPFNPTTTIQYQLSEIQNVKLQIYSLTGKRIRTLINAEQTTGHHSVIWDGKDNLGTKVSSGIYIYKLQAGSFVKMYKMSLLK